MIYLQAYPGAYEAVRRILGHATASAALNAYVGLETAAAARQFDEVVLRHRRLASLRAGQGRSEAQAMTSPEDDVVICLKPADWPVQDQLAWATATREDDLLGEPGPLTHLRSITRLKLRERLWTLALASDRYRSGAAGQPAGGADHARHGGPLHHGAERTQRLAHRRSSRVGPRAGGEGVRASG